ncbi:MAG: hypothetical protein ACOH1T_12455 [Microbacteriaceae bacterium]
MTDPVAPDDNTPEKPKITTTRIVIWIAVAGIGIYYLVSAAIGFVSKG